MVAPLRRKVLSAGEALELTLVLCVLGAVLSVWTFAMTCPEYAVLGAETIVRPHHFLTIGANALAYEIRVEMAREGWAAPL